MKTALFFALTALITLPALAADAKEKAKDSDRKPASDSGLCGIVNKVGFDEYPYAQFTSGSTLKPVKVIFRTGNRDHLAAALAAANSSLTNRHLTFCVETDNLDSTEVLLQNGTRFSTSTSSNIGRPSPREKK